MQEGARLNQAPSRGSRHFVALVRPHRTDRPTGVPELNTTHSGTGHFRYPFSTLDSLAVSIGNQLEPSAIRTLRQQACVVSAHCNEGS